MCTRSPWDPNRTSNSAGSGPALPSQCGVRVSNSAASRGWPPGLKLLAPLGLAPGEVSLSGQVIGTQIEADPTGATKVPGVWVAGNFAAVQAHAITAAAAGLTAAAAINADLVAEDAKRAAANRHEHTH
jgi:hypothetical protein